jgi:lipopolysaccharide assembly outer membrane protein LptD (OstA)
MKLFRLAVAFIACVPVFSQDRLAITFTDFRAATGIRIEGTLNGEALVASAENIQLEGSPNVARLTGNVETTIKRIKLHADEVVLHLDSGEMVPHGHVVLTMAR